MREPNQLEQQPRDCVVEMKIDRISRLYRDKGVLRCIRKTKRKTDNGPKPREASTDSSVLFMPLRILLRSRIKQRQFTLYTKSRNQVQDRTRYFWHVCSSKDSDEVSTDKINRLLRKHIDETSDEQLKKKGIAPFSMSGEKHKERYSKNYCTATENENLWS